MLGHSSFEQDISDPSFTNNPTIIAIQPVVLTMFFFYLKVHKE